MIPTTSSAAWAVVIGSDPTTEQDLSSQFWSVNPFESDSSTTAGYKEKDDTDAPPDE